MTSIYLFYIEVIYIFFIIFLVFIDVVMKDLVEQMVLVKHIKMINKILKIIKIQVKHNLYFILVVVLVRYWHNDKDNILVKFKDYVSFIQKVIYMCNG